MHSTHLLISGAGLWHWCPEPKEGLYQKQSSQLLKVRKDRWIAGISVQRAASQQATAETVAWLSDYPYQTISVYVMCETDIHALDAYVFHDFAHMHSRRNMSYDMHVVALDMPWSLKCLPTIKHSKWLQWNHACAAQQVQLALLLCMSITQPCNHWQHGCCDADEFADGMQEYS